MDATTRKALELITTIQNSRDPFTLDLPNETNVDEVMAELATLATVDAWRAYDLVHQLRTFGRAF